jgi:hypothetical protein
MGNRDKLKALRKAADEAARWHDARTRRRPFGDGIRVPGAGRWLCQVVHDPAFGAGYAWDLCESPDGGRGVLVYRSNVSFESPNSFLIGYEPMEADGLLLRAAYERLLTITMPIAPLFNNMAGLDGQMFYLTLLGDLHSKCHFQWWSDPPPHWSSMTKIVDEMIAHLRARGPGGGVETESD